VLGCPSHYVVRSGLWGPVGFYVDVRALELCRELLYTRSVADTGASCEFIHILGQSSLGHRRTMRISGISVFVLRRTLMVLYIRRLYATIDSDDSCGEI